MEKKKTMYHYVLKTHKMHEISVDLLLKDRNINVIHVGRNVISNFFQCYELIYRHNGTLVTQILKTVFFFSY